MLAGVVKTLAPKLQFRLGQSKGLLGAGGGSGSQSFNSCPSDPNKRQIKGPSGKGRVNYSASKDFYFLLLLKLRKRWIQIMKINLKKGLEESY